MGASHGNDAPKPFVWAKTVDDITKVKRGRAALDRVTPLVRMPSSDRVETFYSS